jgi:hypothetical protein
VLKSDALRAAGLPTHGLGSGRALDRAIAAELIIVEYERVNLCHLFATQRDRKRWHLRHELLLPGTPARRVAEIRAEVSALDAARASTWADLCQPKVSNCGPTGESPRLQRSAGKLQSGARSSR